VSSTQNAYRYKGQQFDQTTGLYNLRARYYNSGQGRFLSQDKAGYNFENPVELNRYGYVAGNPVNRYDPSGYGLIDYTKILKKIDTTAAYALNQMGQLERNLMAGDTYAVASANLWVAAKLEFEWVQQFKHDETCYSRWGRPRVALAFSMVAPAGNWHPIVAARGMACPLFQIMIALDVELAGGEFISGIMLDGWRGWLPPGSQWDWGLNLHAERLLYEAFESQIPSVANRGTGTFYAIGVSQPLCNGQYRDGQNCQRYFGKGMQTGRKMFQPFSTDFPGVQAPYPQIAIAYPWQDNVPL